MDSTIKRNKNAKRYNNMMIERTVNTKILIIGTYMYNKNYCAGCVLNILFFRKSSDMVSV